MPTAHCDIPMDNADRNREQREPTNAELVNHDSFERLRSKNRRKEFFRRIFYVFIAMLLIGVIAVICVIVFFGLKTVEIRGNNRYTTEEILSVCEFTSKDNLVTLDLKEAEASIVKSFPYIREVKFKRVLPSTLILTVVEDTPKYCAEIHNDWFLLSDDLRVISRHDLYEEVAVLSLPVTYLYLPDVDYAVAGETIRFSQASSYRYMTAFLAELSEHSFYPSVQCIDATDRYHIALYAENGRYLVQLGNSESLDTKLRFVAKVLEDETFNANTIASINVEYVSKVIVLKQDHPFTYR